MVHGAVAHHHRAFDLLHLLRAQPQAEHGLADAGMREVAQFFGLALQGFLHPADHFRAEGGLRVQDRVAFMDAVVRERGQKRADRGRAQVDGDAERAGKIGDRVVAGEDFIGHHRG